MKRFFRFCVAVGAGLMILVLAGTYIPRPLMPPAQASGPKLHRILVLSNPIHTDIAIPLDAAVRETFAFLGRDGMPVDDPDVRYLVFGWGGRAFYIETPTWADLKLMPLAKGLTADRAAMHIDVAATITEPHPAVAGHDIGDAEFARLVGYIRNSFRGEQGRPIVIPGAGYGEYDRFYEAQGTFTALIGCNTWTAGGLREAGLRTGWWNPLPVLLKHSMRLYN